MPGLFATVLSIPGVLYFVTTRGDALGAAAFNILDGFEGAVDPEGHRGTTAGWKVSGLPWRQR